jgi:hypothetical protein
MSFIPIAERTLRAAVREPRYWHDGHPEREAFHAWVSQGWRDLVASPHRTADGACVAFVRAYTRVRNGRTERVSAHTRSVSSCGLDEDWSTYATPVAERRGDPPGRRPPADRPARISPLGVLQRTPDGTDRVPPLQPVIGGGGRGAGQSAPASRPNLGGAEPVRIRVHADSQGKHIEGHRDFIPGRSTLTSDPQRLLDGYPRRPRSPCQRGTGWAARVG